MSEEAKLLTAAFSVLCEDVGANNSDDDADEMWATAKAEEVVRLLNVPEHLRKAGTSLLKAVVLTAWARGGSAALSDIQKGILDVR